MEYEITLGYLSNLKPWSAEYVIAHAKYSVSRGERPTVSFRGEPDPEKSLVLAQWMLDNVSHTDTVLRVIKSDMLLVEAPRYFIWMYKPLNEPNQEALDEVMVPGANVRVYGMEVYQDDQTYEVRGFDIEGIPAWFIDPEFKQWIPKNLTWPPESNQAMICK